MNKKYFNLVLMFSVFIITAVAYYFFAQTNQFREFLEWTQDHIVLYAVFLISIKIVGVIYPPIPGGLFTLASIPVLGWLGAYLADFTGSAIGGLGCYFLGKKYGITLLKKLFDQRVIEKIQHLKVKKDKELEAIIVWRILAGGTIIEAIYYGAGLLNVSFANFFIGTTISHMIIGIPSFYLGGAIFSSQNILVNVVLVVLAVIFLYKAKGRYFE